MTVIDVDPLTAIRDQLRAKLSERDEQRAAHDSLLSAPANENRGLNADETVKHKEFLTAIRSLDEDIDKLLEERADIEQQVADMADRQKRDAAREKLALELQPTPEKKSTASVVVKDEPITYRKGGPNSFFVDAWNVRMGRDAARGDSRGAGERLNRHMAEVRAGSHGPEFRGMIEERDVATGGFASLVVPQYLPEMYAEILRATRVVANLASPHDLPPEGMTLTIPRGITGTAVAAQSGENTAVQETDFGASDLTINVRTYAGQQDVSRQAVERGRGVDELIYMDLAADYARLLNSDLINGAGTNGTHLGIRSTSGVLTTTASAGATGTQVLGFIGQSLGLCMERRFLPADTIVMHPRRWFWLQTRGDSTGRPLVVVYSGGNVPMNAFGVVSDNQQYGLVGEILGVQTWIDATIPTTVSTNTFTGATEDVILTGRRADWHFWEEGTAPREFRFEETLGGSLTIKLVVAGYSAFTAGHHPESTRIVSGSSLGTPTF